MSIRNPSKPSWLRPTDPKRVMLVLACADATRERGTDSASRQRALDAYDALARYDAKAGAA